MAYLGDISVHSILLSLQEFLLDQAIDVSLDVRDIQCSSTLRRLDGFCYQFAMCDPLPRLQDAHNSSLGLVVSVCCDTFMCLLILSSGLFELNSIDLNAVFGIGKVGIQCEGIGRVDIATLRVFGQRS